MGNIDTQLSKIEGSADSDADLGELFGAPPTASRPTVVEAQHVPLADRMNDVLLEIQRISDIAVPPEEVADILGKIHIVGQVYDMLKAAADQQLCLRLSDGRQLTVPNGDGTFKRWWYGPVNETKLRKDIGAGEAAKRLLETIGPERLANCLSSSAIKVAATRDELAEAGVPEMFDELFEKITKSDLKTGEPLKGVNFIDERFVKPRGKKQVNPQEQK